MKANQPSPLGPAWADDVMRFGQKLRLLANPQAQVRAAALHRAGRGRPGPGNAGQRGADLPRSCGAKGLKPQAESGSTIVIDGSDLTPNYESRRH